MNPLRLNPQQQQEFAEKLNQRLEKVTMSWDNELSKWHQIALRALDYASAPSLMIPQEHYIKLFQDNAHGLNMNVVQALCNNIESRTPYEMGMPSEAWAQVLLLNHRVAIRWQALARPVEQALLREYEIMNRKTTILAKA